MKRKIKQYKLIFLFILFSTLSLGCYIIFTESTRADIKLLAQQKELLIDEEQELKELIKDEKNLLKHNQEIETKLNYLQKSLPDKSKEDKFIKQIKDLLNENQIRLNKMTPEVSLEKTKNYQALSYKFELRGDYQEYLNFLAALKNSDRLIRIKELLIQEKDEQLFIEMRLTIYYKRDEKDV